MKKQFKSLIVLAGITALLFSSCSKKESGFCYCKYVSGDKKEFNLNYLPENQRQDTCDLFSSNASHFGGSCKLKK